MSDAASKSEVLDVVPVGAATDGSREVQLHPLVLMSICDHFTREQQKNVDGPPPRVLGILFGVQNGNVVDICESYEMITTTLSSGAAQFDEEFLKTKKEHCK